jgi:hypothetical protein
VSEYCVIHLLNSRQERILKKTLSDIRFGVSKMQTAVGSNDNLMEVEASLFVIFCA